VEPAAVKETDDSRAGAGMMSLLRPRESIPTERTDLRSSTTAKSGLAYGRERFQRPPDPQAGASERCPDRFAARTGPDRLAFCGEMALEVQQARFTNLDGPILRDVAQAMRGYQDIGCAPALCSFAQHHVASLNITRNGRRLWWYRERYEGVEAYGLYRA
jgi:hypothetical protein